MICCYYRIIFNQRLNNRSLFFPVLYIRSFEVTKTKRGKERKNKRNFILKMFNFICVKIQSKNK